MRVVLKRPQAPLARSNWALVAPRGPEKDDEVEELDLPKGLMRGPAGQPPEKTMRAATTATVCNLPLCPTRSAPLPLGGGGGSSTYLWLHHHPAFYRGPPSVFLQGPNKDHNTSRSNSLAPCPLSGGLSVLRGKRGGVSNACSVGAFERAGGAGGDLTISLVM